MDKIEIARRCLAAVSAADPKAVSSLFTTEGTIDDFVFGNAARFYTDTNPRYFEGTAVEAPVAELLRGGT